MDSKTSLLKDIRLFRNRRASTSMTFLRKHRIQNQYILTTASQGLILATLENVRDKITTFKILLEILV